MTIYDFSFKSSDGKEISLADYKEKVILVVNTATQCGLSGQFKDLEAIHQRYKDKGLVIIGFPSGQFLQEPETNETVANVCLINFGVTFMLSEKIEVNGASVHPLFAYLKEALPGGILGNGIKWNFTKFLIDKNGLPFKRYAPTTGPASIEEDIVKLLA